MYSLLMFLALIAFLFYREYVTSPAFRDKDVLGNFEKDARVLKVSFLDVGQGDSILITVPTDSGNEYVLIDTGDKSAVSSLLGYLKSEKVSRLSALVLTHPHADHIGNAARVIREFEVSSVVMSDKASVIPSYAELISAIGEKETKVTVPKDGDAFSFGDFRLNVVSVGMTGDAEVNDCSIVLRGVYGDHSFLFTGDAEAAEEAFILSGGTVIGSDVLKVGHHGSSSSSTKGFLAAVSPKYAVISCASSNDFDHPHKDVLDRLEDISADVLRTDLSGCVSFFTDGKKLLYKTEKQSAAA